MIQRIVCLGGHAVRIQAETQVAKNILGFMFDDIPASDYAQIEAEFALMRTDQGWQVIKDEKQVYQKNSLTDAANFLMGEVVYHLIENNRHYMAIHAALLSDDDGGILLPGESGNGKSSLSIWMTKRGYRYHTDELVLIKPGGLQTRVFTRPFNIKAHGIEAIGKLIDIHNLKPAASFGDFITMIPHRALNPNFIAQPPEISRLLFPKFDQHGDNILAPLSVAAAGIELMKTHVIARNLPGHGFKQLLDIVKAVPAYKLNYNHFDALPDLLKGLKIK
jgi:hypothetical protein